MNEVQDLFAKRLHDLRRAKDWSHSPHEQPNLVHQSNKE